MSCNPSFGAFGAFALNFACPVSGAIPPLHRAALNGDAGGIAALLDGPHPPEVDALHHGLTALGLATKAGRAAAVELLLSRGAPVDQVPPGPPSISSKNKKSSWISHIIVGLTINSRAAPCLPLYSQAGRMGFTPAHWAAQRGKPAVLALLLAAGADTSMKEANGFTPVHYSAYTGSVECLDMLLDRGADSSNCRELGRRQGHSAVVDLLDRRASKDEV